MIAIQQPVHKIFVGDKVIDKLFLEYKKGVIKLFHLHVPFLPLERRDNQNAVVVQYDFVSVKEHESLCLAEKIKLEVVGLIPLMQVKPPLSFIAVGGIAHEVHTACAFGIFQ